MTGANKAHENALHLKGIRFLFALFLLAAILSQNFLLFAAPAGEMAHTDDAGGLSLGENTEENAAGLTFISADLADGDYMLNNQYSGHWLSCSFGSDWLAMSTYGSAEDIDYDSGIIIEEYEISGSSVIKSKANPTYLLCGRNSKVTWSGNWHGKNGTSELDDCCRWDVLYLAGGDYTIRNRKTGEYLCVGATKATRDTYSTRASMGSMDTPQFASCIWRIKNWRSYHEIGNFEFNSMALASGGYGYPTIQSYSPSNADYVSINDFDYECVLSNVASVGDWTGLFCGYSGTSKKSTTVYAVHKPSGQKYVFSLVINGKMRTFTMTHFADEGFLQRHGTSGYKEVIGNAQAFASEKFKEIFGLKIASSISTCTSLADFCRKTEIGSVSFSSLRKKCIYANTAGDHLKRENVRDDFVEKMGKGTTTNSKILWTGHILTGKSTRGAPSGSNSGLCTIVVTPSSAIDANGNNKSSTKIKQGTYHTLLHETSHQLGANDHYCKKDYDSVTGKCSNSHCDICVMNRQTVRHCLMGSSIENIPEASKNRIYCEECIYTINSHLANHH